MFSVGPRSTWCLLCCLGLSACHREDPLAASTSEPPPSITFAEVPEPATDGVAEPPAIAVPRDEPPIPMPGPRRKRAAAAVALNATCVSCHDKQAHEWQGSFHQRSNVDSAYTRAFAIEPLPFCRSCHAPEADPAKQPSAAVSELGVACVTCHVTEEGQVLAAASADATERPQAPHAVKRSREFAHQGGCKHCHEFHFPAPGGTDDEFFMQTTAREHLRSPAAAKPCADCHMPLEGGQRSHSFAHVRDPDWHRKNLDVHVEPSTDGLLRLKIVQPNPGHDAPTGDLFRRYEVGYELRGSNNEVLERDTQYLARHFEVRPDGRGRKLTLDNRITAEPSLVEFEVPKVVALDVRMVWWVKYQRVATVGTGRNPAEAIIESEIDLHSGEVPWHNAMRVNQP